MTNNEALNVLAETLAEQSNEGLMYHQDAFHLIEAYALKLWESPESPDYASSVEAAQAAFLRVLKG